MKWLCLSLATLLTSQGVFAQGLYRHFIPPACTSQTSPIGADGINLTGRIRLHGNVPDGVYSTTAQASTGGNGGARQFAWQVTNNVATPLDGYPETGFLLDVQNGATPGYNLTWNNFVQTLPMGFSGDAQGFEAPVGFYVGNPLDVCDNQQGQYFGATFYWDVYAGPVGPDDNHTKLNDLNTGCPERPMAAYAIHLMVVSLHIEDTPIAYTPPRGPPIEFSAIYNHREANQPTNFTFGNLGSKWTHNWLSYVTDDPAAPSSDACVYVRGGGT